MEIINTNSKYKNGLSRSFTIARYYLIDILANKNFFQWDVVEIIDSGFSVSGRKESQNKS